MKGWAKNITVGFLIVVMLISSMGFSINTLYCFCMEQYEASLFAIDHHCNKEHGDSEEDDFLKNLPPCCKKALSCHKAEEQDDCTKRETRYVKADLKFLEYKKTDLPKCPIVLAKPVLKTPFFHTFTSPTAYHPSPIVHHPPPQYFGRKLLNFIQVYRC